MVVITLSSRRNSLFGRNVRSIVLPRSNHVSVLGNTLLILCNDSSCAILCFHAGVVFLCISPQFEHHTAYLGIARPSSFSVEITGIYTFSPLSRTKGIEDPLKSSSIQHCMSFAI